jgi:ABC-2 type transport system ATP-binding protein
MDLGITLENNGRKLIYNYNVDLSDSKISEILLAIRSEQIQINDVHTEQSSLEDIFIELVTEGQS